jgi:hypothetical protein
LQSATGSRPRSRPRGTTSLLWLSFGPRQERSVSDVECLAWWRFISIERVADRLFEGEEAVLHVMR